MQKAVSDLARVTRKQTQPPHLPLPQAEPTRRAVLFHTSHIIEADTS